jgi:2-polyprenyl-6-methoxyphenol hydroxylase-like FAD-dependent oxidoreductase
MSDRYDAVVVGASLAGTAAATLLARAGARVALVERHAELEAHKTACTHYIQANGVPALERLGVLDAIRDAGAVPNPGSFWTRYGWIRQRDPDSLPHGYNITRRRLDPMLRKLAAETPGVELRLGETVTDLLGNGRPEGVRTRRRDGAESDVRARLVVAADGRGSRIAKLSRTPARVKPHGRIGYFAYYADLPPEVAGPSTLWLSDPDMAYRFPQEDGTTLLAAMPTRDKLPAFRRDPEAALRAAFARLPGAADPAEGTRVSKIIGRIDMPNTYRPAARPGLAFVGDAAMAADPVWGVGCGWALESAGWLADAVAGPLAAGEDLDVPLAAYRDRHRRRLRPEHYFLSDYSTGRRFNPVEKALYRAAAVDTTVARHLHYFGNKLITIREFMASPVMARVPFAALRGAAA